MLRPIYMVILIVGVFATAYTAWSWHRISNEVLMTDRSWPRALPYPDGMLLDLNNWFDARNPVPPNIIKLHGEIERVRWTILAALSVSICITLAAALPFAWPWLRRLHRSPGFEIVPSPDTPPSKA